MDIQEAFSKIRSPETLSEKTVFVSLGIYCVSRALLSFINFTGFRSVFFLLLYLTALFGIVVGLVMIIKLIGKIKDDFLKLGFLGLGLWLIAEGLSVFIPSVKEMYFLKVALSFGAGALIIIGAVNREVVRQAAGIFLLGFYLFLNGITVIVNIFYAWDERIQIIIGFAFISLLFMAGLLLMLGWPGGGIIEEDNYDDVPKIE
ncbi:MAG: hypothetical protein JW984_04535 [Deltaproteobacteria bacterium]|uniref:Uncharacterized protein n=1 Tax=Candidatus Zymogenus saltonus TaxID=2844893 RepID=A0A9D8PK59_9DELT|nr:hypothetical protein [Candidatus Zymogenus saltonus]